MFTGIVQGMATVVAVEEKDHARVITLDLDKLGRGVGRGASVSVSGVCLTVTEIEGSCVSFFTMGETLDRTTIKFLAIGDRVNIERSAKLGDEIGGHLVSGHVSGVARMTNLDTSSGDWVITLACDPSWMPYILPKGFVALDGCSLTIVNVEVDAFTIHLIPETLSRTTFGIKKVNDFVNLEIDPTTRAIVDTVNKS